MSAVLKWKLNKSRRYDNNAVLLFLLLLLCQSNAVNCLISKMKGRDLRQKIMINLGSNAIPALDSYFQEEKRQ